MEPHINRVPPPPPRADPAYAQWQQADNCVFIWITQNIESKLVSRVSQQPTAKHVWDALAVTYASGGDKIQIYDLHMKASMVKQGNNSLEETWSVLQELWISIDQKWTNPMKYPADMEIHDQFIQEQRLYEFLIAIDSRYESTKWEIKKMERLPSVDHAYNMVRQEETRAQLLQPVNSHGGTATDVIGAGLAVRGRPNPSSGSRGGNRGGGGWNRRNDDEDKSKLVCSHCKRKKHTKETCFELVGYPEWWQEKQGKPPLSSHAPWNRGGHAAAAVGDVGDGGRPHATPPLRATGRPRCLEAATKIPGRLKVELLILPAELW